MRHKTALAANTITVLLFLSLVALSPAAHANAGTATLYKEVHVPWMNGTQIGTQWYFWAGCDTGASLGTNECVVDNALPSAKTLYMMLPPTILPASQAGGYWAQDTICRKSLPTLHQVNCHYGQTINGFSVQIYQNDAVDRWVNFTQSFITS